LRIPKEVTVKLTSLYLAIDGGLKQINYKEDGFNAISSSGKTLSFEVRHCSINSPTIDISGSNADVIICVFLDKKPKTVGGEEKDNVLVYKNVKEGKNTFSIFEATKQPFFVTKFSLEFAKSK